MSVAAAVKTTDVKGTALVSTIRYIQETFGPEGLAKVTAVLEPEDRKIMESGPLVSSWYPFAALVRLMRAARRQHGDRVPDLYRAMGRASAEYAVTGIYKIFFKVGSPQFIISRGSSVMHTYYSTGDMKTVVSEKGHAVMEMTDFGEPAPELCERLVGWMGRTLELSGGKSIRIVHDVCVNRGGPVCRFEGYWD